MAVPGGWRWQRWLLALELEEVDGCWRWLAVAEGFQGQDLLKEELPPFPTTPSLFPTTPRLAGGSPDHPRLSDPREVRYFYRLTPIAVNGGSFFPDLTGHNISEAAAAGCVVLTGHHVGHFAHMVQEMRRLNPLSVLQALQKEGVSVALRSRDDKLMPGTNIYVVDTLGKVRYFYRLTPIAVIGGSFFPDLTGHNISEAAAAGCAVLTGHHVGHFAHMVQEMRRLNPVSSPGEEGHHDQAAQEEDCAAEGRLESIGLR
ncbi:hypothetical protein RHGRI_007076 [Rhododendron griersonianum]|uniref:Uncharacterized protein n=1 Tax=Rhododendron griersonianum TaxID=479676 RepID=A0AAV6KW92_9ERIC|nr:hypothetical protein RHGRI_007076 [Rhododendron griersonianum]